MYSFYRFHRVPARHPGSVVLCLWWDPWGDLWPTRTVGHILLGRSGQVLLVVQYPRSAHRGHHGRRVVRDVVHPPMPRGRHKHSSEYIGVVFLNSINCQKKKYSS